MDDLTIAFVMRCDERGLTADEGLAAAEELASEIVDAATDRWLPAESTGEER